jgi:hypothetical protein
MTIPTHTNPIVGTSSDEVIADAVICMNILLKRDYLLETATDESYIAALNNIFVGCEGWHDNITWPTEPS